MTRENFVRLNQSQHGTRIPKEMQGTSHGKILIFLICNIPFLGVELLESKCKLKIHLDVSQINFNTTKVNIYSFIHSYYLFLDVLMELFSFSSQSYYFSSNHNRVLSFIRVLVQNIWIAIMIYNFQLILRSISLHRETNGTCTVSKMSQMLQFLIARCSPFIFHYVCSPPQSCKLIHFTGSFVSEMSQNRTVHQSWRFFSALSFFQFYDQFFPRNQ